jgi:hypothetical protein
MWKRIEMKIIREDKTIPLESITTFAEKHDLELIITRTDSRITARFNDIEVKTTPGSRILESVYGYSFESERMAITNYCKLISTKVLVYKAYSHKERKEIMCPVLFNNVDL